MAQRIIDLVLSALASLVSVLLSWPYWRNFEYWPESRTLWTLYVIVGYLLAVYVFYAFLGSLRTLFLHDAQGRPDATASQEKQS
ncbi:hypothetical protein [Castellaniella caeni]|uniref:hypothetical protein n=1 Tax=Castellaniella caeni TaxID=266123 RepID=UPI00083139C2|nr:hypothetical protein [Castellaniella caeni]